MVRHFESGRQVLLDSDLAILYGVETKRLNEQVKRNIERFPDDFMFQLTKVELINLKSQIATSSAIENSPRSQIATLNKGTNLRSQIATSSQEVSLKSQIVTSSHVCVAIFLMPLRKTELLCHSLPRSTLTRCCF